MLGGGINMEKKKCPHCRTKDRSEAEIKDLITRLNRIEGQVKGLKRMLANDAYCVDILTQSSAVTSAINGFNKELLSNHMHSCVVKGVQEGRLEIIDELASIVQRMMK